MGFEPGFTITASLLRTLETIAALRERIAAATVQVAWIPALQKDARVRNAHCSTAIEGNPLTLEQVRELEEGRPLIAATERSQREVLNYFAGLWHVERNAKTKTLNHEHILKLHSIIASGVMDQGAAGRYRSIMVRVGRHTPPPPEHVSGLMRELLDWWNKEAPKFLIRIQRLTAGSGAQKIVLRPKQEQPLQILRQRGSMAPREVWEFIAVSKQAAAKLIKPLQQAGLVQRIGTQKSGRYVLGQ